MEINKTEELGPEQMKLLKQARANLIEAQARTRPYATLYHEIDELVAEIERILGII
jgi:hypothetical protein